MDEYFTDDSDLDIKDVWEDFEYIWSKNIVDCELLRENNPQSGDYFREDEDAIKIRRHIWLNIQGISSDAYRRMNAGIITPDATLHAYAKHDEDIQDLDVIKFGVWKYRIQGFNKSQYSGQVAFQEFDMKRIDKEV